MSAASAAAAAWPALLAALAVAVAVLHGSGLPVALCALAALHAAGAWPLVAVRLSRLAGALSRRLLRPGAAAGCGDAPGKLPGDAAPARPQSRTVFHVDRAGPADVAALTELYEHDYVEGHRRMHPGPAGAASADAWRAALGVLEFGGVVEESRAAKGGGTVRLLKCTEAPPDGSDAAGALVGYVLYELREKGPPKRRQRYCELVNIVVREDCRGCGAGRQLFEALVADLASTATAHSQDLRLYVAERNVGPLAWYRRLGFHPSGWQPERVGSGEVRFMRMAWQRGRAQ